MPDIVDSITGKTKQQKIDVCYLDTTYLNPRYSFPSQEEVVKACADMCVSLKKERAEENDAWEVIKRERAGTGMTKFVNSAIKPEDDSLAMSLSSTNSKPRGRLLVICGTYSIGKERICLGIARALDCKIWCAPGKMRICQALEDEELMSRMTDDPKEAQIHMQMLMEIRAETLQEYLNSYKPHFSRIVGFRPSGWNYRPPNSRFVDSQHLPPNHASPCYLCKLLTRRNTDSPTPQLSPQSSTPPTGAPPTAWLSLSPKEAALVKHLVSVFHIVNIVVSEN
jgi:DNA cross-link repair 1A protein